MKANYEARHAIYLSEIVRDIRDKDMTVEELRALCRAQGLAVGGKKAELVARLLDADAPSEEAVEAPEDAPSEEAASSDETGSVSNESDRNETTDAVG